MKRHLLATLAMFVTASLAQAEIKTKTVTYDYDGATMKGYLAWDDAVEGKRPGILVVHEWWGQKDYERRRAQELAKLGYVALAVDMYGDGKTTEHPKEAGQMAGSMRKNIKTWMGRAKAALKVLQDNPLVDSKKIAAIGYCFGGSTALQMAFMGADLAAAVSFHGALPIPDDEQVKSIKARILICHGADDSFIPKETIEKVGAALKDSKPGFAIKTYPGAKHSFTVPGSEKRGVAGLAYNPEADRRSWQDMQMLFNEVFGNKK